MITLIVARADNGVIGRDGRLPWHIPEDLKRFKTLTMRKPMIMGRKTFESLPGVLPGRRHIVLTRGEWTAPEVEVARSVDAALAMADGDVSVIGGAEIFALFEPLAQVFEVTEIDADVDGDTVMPAPDPARWEEVARDDRDGYSFVTYRRGRA